MALIPANSLLSDSNEISVGMAIKLLAGEQYAKAAQMCDQILAQMPDNATAICVRAHARWRANHAPAECIAQTRKALEIAPDSAVVRTYLATMLVSTGEIGEAKKLLEEALELDPENSGALFDYVDIEKFTEENATIKNFYERFAAKKFSAHDQEVVGFALAKVYDDLKMPERAMAVAREANDMADRKYVPASEEKRVSDLRRLAEYGLDKCETSGKKLNPPIFIVGMPRSGTTLVETILSRHPDIFAAGEMATIQRIEQQVHMWVQQTGHKGAGPHTMLAHVPKNILSRNVSQIRKTAELRADRKFKRFTDKLPMNATRLALISRLYPTAPIVVMHRHPLDVALSNYFKRFSRSIGFSFKLDWIAHYHKQMIEQVEIARKIIPNPVLDLSYETLIEDFEPQVRRLVKFAGLDWNDACLSPEESDRRTVMTASKWQVRQPIYSTSKAKWTRYEPYIADLIEAYGGMDWIEAQFEKGCVAGRSEV